MTVTTDDTPATTGPEDATARCRTCGTLWTGLRDTECNPLCYTCGHL